MRGFIIGIAATIIVRLIGWDTLTTTLGWADDAAKRAYTEAEVQAAAVRAAVAREAR